MWLVVKVQLCVNSQRHTSRGRIAQQVLGVLDKTVGSINQEIGEAVVGVDKKVTSLCCIKSSYRNCIILRVLRDLSRADYYS